jgi:EAL domain-containing protein (putative c-di-GMP-specific phosphodiesterase class I)
MTGEDGLLEVGRERREGRAYVEAAIRNRAFSLVYQPIVHLETGTLSGVEALCRFHDGRPPDVWFKQCEAWDMGGAMDLAIIELALEDLAELPPEGYLALNLSPGTLSRLAPLQEMLEPALARKPIVLELTEHAVVEDYHAAAEALDALRAAGVLLAIDDAGAGYSTFAHILRLRPDIIKLDRSLTQGIDADPSRRALTAALVIFAAEIEASVVAEGIETEAELVAVRTAGVGRGQGYWLGRPGVLPLPPTDYEPVPYVELLTTALPDLDGDRDALAEPPDLTVDATLAVFAHGLLSAMAALKSAVGILHRSDGDLPVEEHRALCGVMSRQADYVTTMLHDLVRGLPPEALWDLERQHGT